MHALHLLPIETHVLPVLDGRRQTGFLLLSLAFHGNVPSGKKRKTAKAAFHACCSLFFPAFLSSTVLRLMSIGRAEAGPYSRTGEMYDFISVACGDAWREMINPGRAEAGPYSRTGEMYVIV